MLMCAACSSDGPSLERSASNIPVFGFANVTTCIYVDVGIKLIGFCAQLREVMLTSIAHVCADRSGTFCQSHAFAGGFHPCVKGVCYCKRYAVDIQGCLLRFVNLIDAV